MKVIGLYSDISLIGHVVMNMAFKNLSISIKTKRENSHSKNHDPNHPSIERNLLTKTLKMKEPIKELRKNRKIILKGFISKSHSHRKQLSL